VLQDCTRPARDNDTKEKNRRKRLSLEERGKDGWCVGRCAFQLRTVREGSRRDEKGKLQ